MRDQVVGEVTLRAPVPASEFSVTFLQGMLNRMTVSFFKYGPVADGYPANVDALRSASDRIERYLETRNTEFLIDAANFMMIEFMRPHVPDAYFEGTDSDRSPGRILVTGERSAVSNSDAKVAGIAAGAR